MLVETLIRRCTGQLGERRREEPHFLTISHEYCRSKRFVERSLTWRVQRESGAGRFAMDPISGGILVVLVAVVVAVLLLGGFAIAVFRGSRRDDS